MSEQKSFWRTLPGILTGLAAVLTAIGGLLVVLSNIGVLGPNNEEDIISSQKHPSESRPSAVLEDQLVAKYKDSGESHFDDGNYKDAIADFEEALKLKPNDAWTLRYLADSYQNNGQLQLALNAINHSIRIEPTNGYSYKVRGLIHYDEEEYDKATSDFEKVLTIEPDNVWSLARLADSYQHKKQNQLALEYINRAVDLDSAYAFSFKVRGRIHYEMKRYPDAISDFRRVLEIEPNNAWSMEFIHKAKEKMK